MRTSNGLAHVCESIACHELRESTINLADELRAFVDHSRNQLHETCSLSYFFVRIRSRKNASTADDDVSLADGCIQMRNDRV